MNTLRATAQFAGEVGETVAEGLSTGLGGLFQVGNGELDENERLVAWKMTHPKKKKTGKSLKA